MSKCNRMRWARLLAVLGVSLSGCFRTAEKQGVEATTASQDTPPPDAESAAAGASEKDATTNLTGAPAMQGNSAGGGGNEAPPAATAAAFGCTGSSKAAFEGSYATASRALANELAARRKTDASEKDAWRHGRLAILRTLSSGPEADVAGGSDAQGSAADETLTASKSGDPSDEGDAKDRTGAGVSRETWNEGAVRCKRLGALLGAARITSQVTRERSLDLCASLAPARVGTLAAQVACRLRSRGGDEDVRAFGTLSSELPTLAPQCGDGYVRACAEILKARLADSPAERCRTLAKEIDVVKTYATWACGRESR